MDGEAHVYIPMDSCQPIIEIIPAPHTAANSCWVPSEIGNKYYLYHQGFGPKRLRVDKVLKYANC
jgi:hypothetical protein